MRMLFLASLVVGAALLVALSSDENGSTAPAGEFQSPSAPEATVAQASQAEDAADVRVVEIALGNFFFRGPAGTAGPQGNPTKGDVADEGQQVVARLVNGKPVKLVFVNVSQIQHQVVSPLLSAPEEKAFDLGPRQRVAFEFTPNFRSVEDGGTLSFELSCHVRHGSSTDHYKLGMVGVIEIVPPEGG